MKKKLFGLILPLFMLVAIQSQEAKESIIEFNGIAGYSRFGSGSSVAFKFTNKTGKSIKAFSATLTKYNDFGEKESSQNIKATSYTPYIKDGKTIRFLIEPKEAFIFVTRGYETPIVYTEEEFAKDGYLKDEDFLQTAFGGWDLRCIISAVAFADGDVWKKN